MEEHKTWLRKRYQEAPLKGSCAKKVKLSDVFEELEKQFVPAKFSANIISQTIKEAFPQSCTKPSGKLRHKFISGIEPVSCDTSNQVSCNHAALLELE